MRVVWWLLPLLALFPPRRADACSPPPCSSGFFIPPSGTVPANTPAFRWRPVRVFSSGPLTEVPSFRLEDEAGASVEASATIEDDGSVRLVPGALREGATLTFTGSSSCEGASPVTATFDVGPLATRPASLGAPVLTATAVNESLATPTSSGSCTSPIRAAVATVAPAAGPWRGLLPYAVFVDDVAWSNPSGRVGTTATSVYAACSDPEDPGAYRGTSLGEHRIRLEAVLPGTDTTLASETWVVDLRCDGTAAPPRKEGDAPDAGTVDPGDGGGEVPDPPVGCGCDASGALGAALGLGARVRRRSMRGAEGVDGLVRPPVRAAGSRASRRRQRRRAGCVCTSNPA